MEKLKTNYLDMVLIHWPGVKGLKLDDKMNQEFRKQTWLELERLYSEKLVKIIGISNYNINHMKELISYANISPQLLQVLLIFSFRILL